MIDQGQAGSKIRRVVEVIVTLARERGNAKKWARIPISEIRLKTGLPATYVRRSSVYAERCGLVRLASVREYGLLIVKPVDLTDSALTRIGGHLYVIEFTGGVLKVGYSAKPRERLQAHRSAAAIWSQTEIRHLVSPYYENARAAEGYVIEVACYFAERVHGEWFRAENTDAFFDRMSDIFSNNKEIK